MKLCKRCGEIKPTTEFHRQAASKDGLQAWCKPCAIAAVRALHQSNPAKHAAYNREWGRKNPESVSDNHLKWRLGLSRGTYASMLAAQDGKCGICGTDKPASHPRYRRFAVDHDEATGQVRGLLCNSCNNGIGRFQHDPDRLHKAIAYLLKYC